ncbi:NACHT domain-containing protein [Streptomyces durmitorensis]|uniref:NACHT domain-containing protein n=1 Tax=Streptomyces durmitorensis TaxID=319947 RepID=A0ABY4PTU4_9ACTN|nr:NACHT domain-containing protein [Streptomyces durmitorensis]UQT57166.1 NACHT domain-containing protein [Streptomyces durmitorensis]
MDPAVIGARLASGVVAPLIKKLFVREGPGAGLVDRPVRLSGLVSFRGEKRTLDEKDFRKLVVELTRRAAREAGESREAGETHEAGETREPPTGSIETEAVADALERTLYALADLDLSDVEAVRLGQGPLATKLYDQAGGSRLTRPLSQNSASLYIRLLDSACLHILHFLTQRSTFIARSLVEQSRQLDELITRTDVLIQRVGSQSAQDAGFEGRYEAYVAKKHSHLTIYGIDLNECRDWPLDTAYLSLRASRSAEHQQVSDDAFATGSHEGAIVSGGRRAPSPVEGVFAGTDRVLLRGAAGSGKTTLVQWLAVTTARQDRLTGDLAHLIGRVPYVLPLRTLTRGGASLPTPADFLGAVGNPLAGAQPTGWTDRVLSAGRGLLLIDGIDEVPEEERERTRRWLSDLLTAYPGNLWLVTSRPSAVREDWLGGEDFTDLTLSQMGRENIGVFIRRWHEAAGADAALGEALLSAVRTKQDLGRLATNPLMCALMCALHRERRGFLPRGRKALYDAALSMLLERRDRERDMAVELDEESQIELLQKLAYWLIRNGRAEMDHTDAVHQLERLLPSMPYVAEQGQAEDILRHLLVRSGLLREPGPGAVDFVHRTFQDYLGARAAVEERDFDLLLRHAHLDQWEDVVRMAVAHARPDERVRLLRGVMKRGDKEPEHRVRLHLLAMACLEHAAKLDPEVRGKVERRAGELIPPRTYSEARKLSELGPILLELLPGPEGVQDGTEAALVVSAAAQMGGDAALSYLVKYRHQEDPAVRFQLGSHWDRFDTETYAQQIIGHLHGEAVSTITVRSAAELSALSRMGGHRGVDLTGDFTRSQIMEALDEVRLEHLTLTDNAVIDDLEFVGRFRNLKRLSLRSCSGVSSLAPVTGLPLKELVLFNLPLLQDLSPIREFDQLTMVSARAESECPVLDLIPREAPLECVFPPRNTVGLTALRNFPSLTQLGLELEVPINEEDWRAIATLTHLTYLSMSPHELASLAATGVQLHAVSQVSIMARGAECDLRQVVTAFPSMTHLHLYEPMALELTPLRGHSRLKRVTVVEALATPDPAQLPDSVQLTVDGRPVPRT